MMIRSCIGLSLACLAPLTLSRAPAQGAKEAAAKEVFVLAKVHELHLRLDAKEYEKMQPAGGGMGFPGFFGPKKGPEKPADKAADVHRSAGVFNLTFPWVRGEFTAEGRTFKNAGVRYKGNFTYVASAGQLKRSLKIDLDHYGGDQRWAGMRKLNLSSGVTDPERLREALSFAVFRNAGVPAPRTAYAELTLTVPGKYDKELVGLFTLIEQVDKSFLTRHFKNPNGMLLKPENLRGLDYLGDKWAPYAEKYRPKDEPTKKQQERLIEFTRLVNRAGDEQFRKEIAAYLDVESFLRYLAANALLANLDSFLGFGHNYYLYLRNDTNKFVFIPWDLDLSMATWPAGGTPQQQMDLSIAHPHAGDNKLIDRLLAMPGVKEQYQKLVKDLAETCFTKEKLLKDVAAVEQATKPALAREKQAVAARKEGKGGFGFGPPGAGMFGQSPDARTFIEKRTASVAAQLEGKSKGFVPAVFGFGPPGGGPKGGPGFGNPWAKPLLEALDADKDGKVSKDELSAGVKKFFAQADEDKKGALDEGQLADGFNRIIPQPPAFGGPPGGFPSLEAQVIPWFLKDGLKLTDEQRRQIDELQREADAKRKQQTDELRKEADARLAKFLTKEQLKMLQESRTRPAFGPGNLFARPIMQRADTKKNGKATLDELITAAEALFQEADRNKDGRLDEPEIGAGIGLLLPPPGFGPPAGDAKKNPGFAN